MTPLHEFLTSAMDGGEWSDSRPGRFTPRETDPDTHWIGRWLDSRVGMDAVSKTKDFHTWTRRILNHFL